MNYISIIILIFSLLIVYKNPYWGIIILVSSLPLLEAFPQFLSITSFQLFIGGLTFAIFLLKNVTLKPSLYISFNFNLCLLLVIYIIVSNLRASILLGDRVWMLTYVQLLMLFWLTEQMFCDVNRIELLFLSFSGACVIASIIDIYNWTNNGFSEFLTFRSSSLQSSNEAARYYLLSSLILFHFLLKRDTLTWRILGTGLIATHVMAILITGSKTVLLLLPITIILLLIYITKTQDKQHMRFAYAVLCIIVLITVVLNMPSLYSKIIFPLIENKSGTYGLRLTLIDAGIAMFKDHPLIGVGIGQYPDNLRYYGYQAGYHRAHNLTPHNTYIQMLSETGVIGFGIFIMLIVSSLIGLIKIIHRNDPSEKDVKSVSMLILIMCVLILIGAWSKTEGASKLLWLLLGLSSLMPRLIVGKPTKSTVSIRSTLPVKG